MKQWIKHIGSVICIIIGNTSLAKPIAIKVAVIENLKLETFSTDKYAVEYLDGLKTAMNAASEDGYAIELKTFFYDKEPLAILKQVPAVKAWSPDLIIGPRSSALFLLLKDQFKDVLVLSPFATASDISSMPSNFYSLTFPNEYFTQAIVNLVSEKFKGKAVAPIGEVDCKNCMNFIDEFSSIAKKSGVSVRSNVVFLNAFAEQVPPSDLLVNYKQGDVILLPNTSYTSGTLIGRLTDYLKDNNIVFIGGDGWGDWSTSYVGKVKSTYKYAAYRATPWSLDAGDVRTKTFLKQFRRFRKTESTSSASILSYSTLMAAVEAIKHDYNPDQKIPLQIRLLKSFQAELKSNKNYARPMKYTVYKVTQSGEVFDSEVSPLLRSSQ